MGDERGRDSGGATAAATGQGIGRTATRHRRPRSATVLLAVVIAAASFAVAPLVAGASSATIAAHMVVNSITYGQGANVVGTVSPAGATPRVVVQRRINGVWSDRNAGAVDPDGTFDIAIHPTQVGIYALRVRSNGGSVVTAAFYLRVKLPPTCTDPEQCVIGLFNAWKAGDKTAAAKFADSAAVKEIFAEAYSASTGWASGPVQAEGGDPQGTGFEWLSTTQHELDFGVINLNYPNLPQAWQVQDVSRTLSGEGACDTQQMCAESLFAYWQEGDRTFAQFVASTDAVNELFARTYKASDHWIFDSCSGAAGSTGCVWNGAGGHELIMLISNGTGSVTPPPPPPPYQVRNVSFM